MNKKPLIVNFFAGPGAGKSTMASRVFSELKERHYNAELITEFAKDLTWEKSTNVLDNQLFVFANQHHRLWRLSNDLDVVVSDSPLMLSLVYARDKTTNLFKQYVVEEFKSFNNINIILERVKKYNPKGRNQNEDQAKDIDELIKQILLEHDIEIHDTFPGNTQSVPLVVELIENKMQE
jgi:GTPase SAR1 family protein